MLNIIYKHIERLKTKNEILIFLQLFDKGVMEESELCKQFAMHNLKLKKIMRNLISAGLAVALSDDTGAIYFAVTNKTYEFVGDCSQCKKKSLESMPDSSTGKEIKYYRCPDEMCKYQRYFNNKVKVLLVKEITKRIDLIVYSQNKGDDGKGWNLNKYCTYVKDKYEKAFPGIRFKFSANFRRVIAEYLILVKGMVNGVNVDSHSIDCIDEIFSRFITNESFNLKDFTNFTVINSILNNKKALPNGKGNGFIGTCDKFEIRCTYWVKGCCELKASNIKCTKTIRSLMGHKYNANAIFDIKGQTP